MKAAKIFKWSLIVVPVVIVAVGGLLYMLASMTPGDYKPQVLDSGSKEEVRLSMQNKLSAMMDMSAISPDDEGSGIENIQVNTITEIDPKTGKSRTIRRTTFEMPMEEDEVNQWISAMSDTALDKLAASGVSQPAISITEKGVTLFAHVRKFDKVVGMDMDMNFRDDETCVFNIKPSSVGKLPIPEDSVDMYRDKVAQKARKDVKGVATAARDMFEGETGDLAASVVEGMGSAVGDAIAGEPVKIQFEQNGSTVRVRGLKTVDGKVTLDMVSDKDLSPKSTLDKTTADTPDKAAQAKKLAAQQAAQPTAADVEKVRKLTPEDMQAADLSKDQDKKMRSIAGLGN